VAYLPEETPKYVIFQEGTFEQKIHLIWGEVVLCIHKDALQEPNFFLAEIRPTEHSMRKTVHANMFYEFRRKDGHTT
jgi:hypothetical protein